MTKLIAAILSLAVAPGVFLTGWAMLRAVVHSEHASPLAWGLAAGALVDQVVRRWMRRFHTFEHELTHAIAALLFLRRVTGFVVSSRGGTVQHVGGFGGSFGSTFIALAPYVVPTFAVAAMLGRPWVPDESRSAFDLFIGVTLGYHLLSTIRETAQSFTSREFISAGSSTFVHTDLATVGFAYSTIFILVWSVGVHGALLAVLLDGFPGLYAWGQMACGDSLAFWHRAYEQLTTPNL